MRNVELEPPIDILRCPPLPAGRIAGLQAEARRLRSEGWSREGADT